MKKIKVGYISPVNPKKDRMAWSGTYYNTFHAIRDAGAEVEWVSYNTQSIIYKLATKCATFDILRFYSWTNNIQFCINACFI